jgi:hypothetical protein
MTTFIPSQKPLSEWKYYVRARDFSIHQSPDVVVDGIEVPPPPNDSQYTWDWQNNQWMVDTPKLKRRAQREVQEELDRIKKFNDLEANEKAQVASDLAQYRNALRLYIKNFDHTAPFPQVPASLTDDNFYLL